MHNVTEPTDTANTSAKPETASPPAEPPRTGSTSAPPESGTDPLVHFALRSDGAILLNAADLKGFDLSGREVFIGVVLTPLETRATVVRLGNAAADAAAKLLGALLKTLSRLTS